MADILSYGCTSAAGVGVKAFFEGLLGGVDHSSSSTSKQRICRWKKERKEESKKEILISELGFAWKEAIGKLDPNTWNHFVNDFGVIFASTKGCIDDYIWDPKEEDLKYDPFTPVLNEFLKRAELKPRISICISNACTSSHAAFYVAEKWLEKKLVSHVIVLCGDVAGSFVRKGFSTLQILSQEKVTPFGQDRSGLQLGEGATAVLLGEDTKNRRGGCRLSHCHIHAEGHSVLRPSPSAEGLIKTIVGVGGIQEDVPDVVIAHGTGTVINDSIEDEAFQTIFGDFKKQPRITGTKWSIGHTLGASGSFDLIAACEIVQTQKIFSIANTTKIDSSLKYGRYLGGEKPEELCSSSKNILVTSMGFGGLCGAFRVS